MRRYSFLVVAILSAACTAVYGAEDQLLEKLAAVQVPEGWKCAGDIATYDRSNLFELIDGEAELYFPYGFKRAIAVNYASTAHPQDGIAAEIYEVGSTLDAFGVYSNYRDMKSRLVPLGVEGFVSRSQAMFYQAQFFVKVRARGTSKENQAAVLPCAQAISGVLPKNSRPPDELEMLDFKYVIPKTQQYFPQSVLGYDCFTNGLVADSLAYGKFPVKIFIIIEITSKTAREALQCYETFLKTSKAAYFWKELSFGKVLVANDPLHKQVIVKQFRNMLLGVAKSPDPKKAFPLLESLQSQVTEKSGKNLPKNVSFVPPPATR
jgi:hypothetical protein